MSRIGNKILFFLFYFLVSFAHAEVSIEAFVDRNSVGEQENFIYVLRISSSKSIDIEAIEVPRWSTHFQVVREWKASEYSTSFVNGSFKSNRIKKIHYQIRPKSLGSFTLSPSRVTIGGKIYTTNSININVVKQSQAFQYRSKRGQKAPDPFQQFNNLLNQFVNQKNRQYKFRSVDPEKAFFIRAEIDKTSVFVNEAITISFYIYVQGQLRGLDTLKYPSFEGFWKEDIQHSNRLHFNQVKFKGENYSRSLVTSYVIFPFKEGVYYIDPYKVRATLYLYTGRSIAQTRSSERIPISVKALPRPFPENFSGVGNFELDANLEASKAKADEPLLFTITVKGEGNAKFIEMPEIDYPKGIEVYDTKKKSEFFPKTIMGKKTFEILLVPRKSGQFTIPDIKMSFFDPKRKRYYFKRVSLKSFFVSHSKNKSGSSESFMSEDSKPKSFYPQPVYEKSNPRASIKWTQGLAVLFLGLFSFFTWKILSLLIRPNDSEDLKSVLKERLLKIDQLAIKMQWRQVGVEATNTIYWVLGRLSSKGRASEEIGKLLLNIPPSVRRTSEVEIQKLLSLFETLSFAPEEVMRSAVRNKKIPQRIKELKKLLRRCVDMSVHSGGNSN